VSRALSRLGIAVLRFDFTGLGGSEGDFANTNFSSNVGDILAAVAYLRDRHVAPSLLIGHSLGGTAVLSAAQHVPEARAVATIGAPSEPAHVEKRLGAVVDTVAQVGEATVNLGGREFTIKKQFLDDLADQKLLDCVGTLHKALIVFHAPRDEVVGIDNAAQIFQAAKHPKSFVSLDNANHLLTGKADGVYVADVLAAWVERYLPPSQNKNESNDVSVVPRGAVRVTESGNGPYAQTIETAAHHFVADEPADVGGKNSGPSPYDLLLAALGACTSMTMRMYARRKDWPLARVSVTLIHEKLHAEDCAECESRESRVDRIERTIRIEGDLDGEQRERLMQIAKRCPVHQTLTSETVISDRVDDS
jgi:putative redox protein